jgi:hypothetical protein
MKAVGGIVVALILAPFAAAGNPRANELVGLMTQTIRATTEQLQLVQHAEGARLSADQLRQLNGYLAGMLAEERRAPTTDADPAVINALDQAVAALRPEWDRVVGNDQLKATVAGLAAIRRVVTDRAGGRADAAVCGVRGLSDAVASYELRHGRPPERLEQLLARSADVKPFIDAAALTDPWGRPYQYDPAGPKNAGVRPDVWSLGPPAGPAKVIGNWPD